MNQKKLETKIGMRLALGHKKQPSLRDLYMESFPYLKTGLEIGEAIYSYFSYWDRAPNCYILSAPIFADMNAHNFERDLCAKMNLREVDYKLEKFELGPRPSRNHTEDKLQFRYRLARFLWLARRAEVGRMRIGYYRGEVDCSLFARATALALYDVRLMDYLRVLFAILAIND